MWSRFTVVVRQLPHWQVKFKLLVLLRPTWRSQTWSWLMFSNRVTIATTPALTYIKLFSRRQTLAAGLPLTGERVGAGVCNRRRCGRVLLCRSAHGLLLWCCGRSRHRCLLFAAHAWQQRCDLAL
jgi:hypothetical protein